MANYRVNRLAVAAKSLEVESPSESMDRVDVVNDVRQPLSGFLEGMNHVVQYTVLEQWLECPPIHDVTRTVEEFVDVDLQSGVLKNAHWPILVELHQHINIAFRAFFASCHRTEHCGVCHSKPP